MTSPVLTAPAPGTRPMGRGAPRAKVGIAVRVIAALAIFAGLLMRAWFLGHRPVSSDEAVVGLMAHQILHGHTYTFYWGQVYGGVEPYVVSAAFAVLGTSVWVLRGVPIVLAAVAAVLTWRTTRRLVPDPAIAVLAGVLVWATPASAVANSFIEWGFRAVTLVCGVAMLLLSLRILDGDRRWWAYASLGLVSGLGWWSSPEIVYFALPSVLILGGAVVRRCREGRYAEVGVGLAAGLAATVLGALPWLWTNAHTSFRSLSPAAFGNPPGEPGYSGRLHLFIHNSVPMLVSMRDLFTGAWIGGKAVAVPIVGLLLAALAIAIVLCLLRRGRAVALAVSVLAFPLLLAESPASWNWVGGRYIGYVVPLYVMVLAIGAAEAGKRLATVRRRAHTRSAPRERGGRYGFVVLSLVLLATSFSALAKDPTPGQTLLAGWGNPNAPTFPVIRALEYSGVSEGYANYWVAYRLDYLSNERLRITVGKGELDRWPALNQEVTSNGSAAWIFVKPIGVAGAQFGELGGPGGLTQPLFLAELKHLGVGYRTVDAGLVEAFIPARPVPASELWPKP